MAQPGGLSIRPSPQTAEVSTPELWLGNRSRPPWCIAPHAQELAAFIGPGPGEISASSYGFYSNLSRTLQLQQKGPHQHQERSQSWTPGCPGRPRKVRFTNTPVRKRFAGFDGNLPQVQRAQALHGGLDVVFFPHRDTATGQDHVVGLGRIAQACHGGLTLVGHDAQIGHFAAHAA
jgi:hypothetical protein